MTMPRTDRPVCILGAGALGHRIGCVFVAAGYNVHLYDLQQTQAINYIDTHKNEFRSVLRINNGSRFGLYAGFTEIHRAASNAWLALETRPVQGETGDITVLDSQVPADCIFVSNGSFSHRPNKTNKVSSECQQYLLNVHFVMPPVIRTVWFLKDHETETDSNVVSYVKDIFRECGLLPLTTTSGSTDFLIHRLWAAVMHESVQILTAGVHHPTEIDQAWESLFTKGPLPSQLSKWGAQDIVSLIEDDRTEASLTARDKYIAPVDVQPFQSEPSRLRDIYLLDLGLGGNTSDLPSTSNGRILRFNQTTQTLTPVVKGQNLPDGIDVSHSTRRIFWTNMGKSVAFRDGSVWSANLDGSDIRCVLPVGSVYTPKQIVVDETRRQLYFCDREGASVHRCGFDGRDHRILIQRQPKSHPADQMTQWCVGMAIDTKHAKMYWTQKGPSKGNRGRIFCAGIEIPPGETAENRSDIRLLFDNLPEPIDVVIDSESELLYWTDRGEHPAGSALYYAYVGKEEKSKTVLARHFHEPIGLKLDRENNLVYVVDAGGSLYSITLDHGIKRVLVRNDGVYTGISLL